MVGSTCRQAVLLGLFAFATSTTAVPALLDQTPGAVTTPFAGGAQLPLPLVIRRRGILATRGKRWVTPTEASVVGKVTGLAGEKKGKRGPTGDEDLITLGPFGGRIGVASGSGTPFIVAASTTGRSGDAQVASSSTTPSSASTRARTTSSASTAASVSSSSSSSVESSTSSRPSTTSTSLSTASTSSSPSSSSTSSSFSTPVPSVETSSPVPSTTSASVEAAAASASSAAQDGPFSISEAFSHGSKYYPFAVAGAVIIAIGASCALIWLLQWLAHRRSASSADDPIPWVPRSHSQALLTPPAMSRTASDENRPRSWVRFGRDEEETAAAASVATSTAPIPWTARQMAGWADATPLTLPDPASNVVGNDRRATIAERRLSLGLSSFMSPRTTRRTSELAPVAEGTLPMPVSTPSRTPIDVRARLGLGRNASVSVPPPSPGVEVRERDAFTRKVTGQ